MAFDRAKLQEMKAADRPKKFLEDDLPFWGKVRARAVTTAERDQYEADTYGPDADCENVRARWIALCVVDGEGNRVFTGDDVAWLKNQEWASTQPLFALCQRVNGQLGSNDGKGNPAPPGLLASMA